MVFAPFYRLNMVVVYALLIFIFFPTFVTAQTLEKISLQLEWKYQFEYAGFIMAKEKGFYNNAGLDVELRQYSSKGNVIKDVLSKKANYGIYNSSVVIRDGSVEAAVLLATYLQQSPLVLITSKEIKSPSSLIGKRIMGTHNELMYSSLALMLNSFSVNKKNTVFKDQAYNINDFIQHKVDAITIFKTNQLYELDRKHVEYNIIDPSEYGFVMTAVNLFSSKSEVIQHPERTKRFIKASNQGWAYALEHPEETISIIYKKYSKLKSIDALRYEAKATKKAMLLKLFPIGAPNKILGMRAIEQFQYSGILKSSQKNKLLLFDDIVKDTHIPAEFTDKQSRYLVAKGSITMCVDPEWMPFESIQNGKHIGIAADVISILSKSLPIPIRLIETNSWQESILKAQNRECDIYSLAASTPERLKYMDFTSPYINLPIVMATKVDKPFIDNIEGLKGESFAIVEGYAIAEELRNKMKDINIVDVKSISDGLKRVENGEFFGYIDNLMTIANAIQKDFTGNLKISSRLDSNVKLAIGTRNDEPILHDIFEILITNLSPVELQGIYNKWVSIKQDVAFDYNLLWKGLFVFLILLAAFIYHYSKLKNLNSQLSILSITDKLTGLYNRVKTDALLLHSKATLDRYGTESSIILIDIDLFKNINDTHGHQAGDVVLSRLAKIFISNTREVDCVGRWGGEEFLLICPNTGIEEAKSIAEKVLHEVRNHSFPNVGQVTVSAGVGVLSKDLTIEESLSRIDKALYKSKAAGRDQIHYMDID